MRTPPSAADQSLIEFALERWDLSISPAQLERWRQRGLLPRATVVRGGFGGSQVLEHPVDVYEAVSLLAAVSRQGRPWQVCAWELFEQELPISTESLRATGLWRLRSFHGPASRAWAAAELVASPSDDPDEELGEIGELAAERMPRDARSSVKADMQLAHPYASPSMLAELVDRALTWRLVDLNAPERMTEGQRNIARHGVPEPMSVLGPVGIVPLPSERAVVATTLTWAEAEVFREWAKLIRREDPQAQQLSLLDITTWMVTGHRRNQGAYRMDVPLSQESLIHQRFELEEATAEASIDGVKSQAD